MAKIFGALGEKVEKHQLVVLTKRFVVSFAGVLRVVEEVVEEALNRFVVLTKRFVVSFVGVSEALKRFAVSFVGFLGLEEQVVAAKMFGVGQRGQLRL